MRFLLDENMRSEVAEFLKGQDHDVMFVPKGLKNGQVLALAQRESRISGKLLKQKCAGNRQRGHFL